MSGRLPLYAGNKTGAAAAACFQPIQRTGRRVWGGNAGLWYDKFCDRWAPDFTAIKADKGREQSDTPARGSSPKLDWVESVIYPRQADGTPNRKNRIVETGDPALLAESACRRRALAEAQGGLCLEFILESRLLTGLGRSHPVDNGMAWHPTLGVPFLAGSGVKGLLRSWAYQIEDADLVALFGPPTKDPLNVGALCVLDALPVAPVTLVAEILTPHTGPWNQVEPDAQRVDNLAHAPADWHSPIPIPLLAVETGAVFQFILLPGPGKLPQGGNTLERCAEWLTQALRDLGAGAKTTSGYGRFRPDKAPVPEAPNVDFGPRARLADALPTPPRLGRVNGEPVRILEDLGRTYWVEFLGANERDEVSKQALEFDP